MDGKRVILAAHRGDKFHCPENTMPAFCAAIEAGVDMIETDVRMTKDGELILIHDRSALRTAGVDVNVDELTLEELKKLDAGAVFSEQFKGTEIPTVRELLELVSKKNVLVNWELKVYPGDFGSECAFGIADKLIAMIEEYDFGARSMLNSFSDRLLAYIYEKHGHHYPIHGQGIWHCRRSVDEAEMSEEELFDWCCLYPGEGGGNPVDYKENFDYCLQNCVLPCVCIPDVEQTYAQAISYGCKMFTSNNILEADRILKKIGVR